MKVFSDSSMMQAAGIFLGHLAYPGKPKAEILAGNIICSAVDLMVADPIRWGEAPESLRLSCRLRDRNEGERLLKSAARIINGERMIAAKQAWPKLHAAACDDISSYRPPVVPGPLSRDMITAVSNDLDHVNRDGRGRKTYGGSSEANKANIAARCWKPTLPVLHLAVAYSRTAHELGVDGFSIGDLVTEPEVVEWMIGLAAHIAPLVAATFGMNEQGQIKIAPFGVQKS